MSQTHAIEQPESVHAGVKAPAAPAKAKPAASAASAVLALQSGAGNRAVAAQLKKTQKTTPALWQDGTMKKFFDVVHDHGFLDDGKGNIDPAKKRAPDLLDRATYAGWKAALAVGEANFPELSDALKAYRHFLEATGTPLQVDYEKYLTEDWSGRRTLRAAEYFLVQHTKEVDNAWLAENPHGPLERTFDVAFGPMMAGEDGQPGYPYPATENWQKAIGGHVAWIAARVTVKREPGGKRRFLTFDMTLNMEDRYNFTPRSTDIKTALPDSWNGRLEESGLGKEFMQHGSAKRAFSVVDPPTRSESPFEPVPDIPHRSSHTVQR